MAKTKDAMHYIGKRLPAGTHKRPEYTAAGAGIFERNREWPTSDKFLAHLRAAEIPRFEDRDRADVRRARRER